MVSAIIRDYTIITCRDVGCGSQEGICKDDGYCYYDGIKERRSCAEVPESCKEEDGRLCYTERDYPVCVFVREQKRIIRDKEEGDNIIKINFNNNIRIGDEIISSSIDFVCNPQGENWNAPQPSVGCWKVNAEGYTMYIGDEVRLNEWLSLKLNGISANYHYCEADEENCVEGIKSSSRSFALTMDLDSITINHIENEKYFIVKDSQEKMCFGINNQLANFNHEEAGFYVRQYNDILGTEKPPAFRKNAVKKGENTYCTDTDTSMYGEVEYGVHFYFIYKSDTTYQVFDNENLLFRYKIVDEEDVTDGNIYKDDGTTYIDYKSPECIKDEQCNDFDSKTRDECVNNVCVNEGSYTMYYIIGGIIFLLVLIIIGKRR